MLKPVLCALLLVCVATTAQAHPFDRFAGQTNPVNGLVCDPAGSTSTMAACSSLYIQSEDAALAEVSERFSAKARAADTEYARVGAHYMQSFQLAQDSWRKWRDQECDLATIDSMGGSMTRISYPLCIGNMTAARRRQIEALLALWDDEFRVNGNYVGTGAFFPPNPAD